MAGGALALRGGSQAQTAVTQLACWIGQRPGMAAPDAVLAPRTPPWQSWGCGTWLYLENRRYVEPEHGDSMLQHGFHGTTLSVLYRIFLRGMENGMAVITSGSREYRGVYNHSLERVHLCQHYMLYSAVDRTGYYFAPLLELHYADPDLQGRPNRVRRAKKSQLQFLTYDDACAVRGVWFHMVAAVEFCHLPANCWACFEPRLLPELELDPAEDRGAIMARSQRLRDVLP